MATTDAKMKHVGWEVISDEQMSSFTTLPGSNIKSLFCAWRPASSFGEDDVRKITAQCPDLGYFADIQFGETDTTKCFTQQQVAEIGAW